MLRKLLFAAFATALTLGVSTPTAHALVTDASGDFLASYTGTPGADLDVLTTDVLFDGTSFTLTATLAGNIGATPNAIYVFGFDRGGATASPAAFASIGVDNVFFNSVVILRPDTTVTINRLGGGGTTNLAVGAASVTGNAITARIPIAELPTTGFASGAYTWNLWPRINGGTTANISDFAPNNSNAAVVSVPEAGSLQLLAPALLGMLGVVVRRRRKAEAVS